MSATVLPGWIDEVPGVDFGPEKRLLEDLEAWAKANGWVITDGQTLPAELRQRTDVLLERAGKGDSVRVAILRKSPQGTGTLRLDSSALRTLEVKRRRRPEGWRVWAGGVPIEDNLSARGWGWLFDLLFRD